MKHPVSRDEIHEKRAKRQRAEKRAAAAARELEEEVTPLAEAVRQARERRIAQVQKS